MFWKKHSTLGKICAVFVLLVIPWLIISLSLLHTTNERMQAQTILRIESSRNAVMDAFETQLIDTLNAAEASDALQRSVSLAILESVWTESDYFQQVDQIYDSLSLVKMLGNFVENARIYILPMNIIFNATGYTGGSVQTLDQTTAEHITTLASNGSALCIDNDRIVMLLKSNRSAPMCVIEVELSAHQLKKQLTNTIEFPDHSQYALFLHNNKELISNFSDTSFYPFLNEASGVNEHLTPIETSEGSFYLYKYRSSFIDFTYYEVFPASCLLLPVQMSGRLTIGFVILSLTIIAIFFASTVHLIHHPLQGLIQGFNALQKGDFQLQIDAPETPDFSYLYDSFNQMTCQLDQLIQQTYQQKILLQKAEFRQLQAQINPHFLYNSFFLLQRVIASEDTEQAESIATALGCYFRYITRQNSDIVYLYEEMEHARIYADIQAIRFDGRIEIELQPVPCNFQQLQVPKLFIQPLIENAFHYALENRVSGGILRLRWMQDANGHLCLIIEDNGEALSNEKLIALQMQLHDVYMQPAAENLTGLMNIAKRLQLYFQSGEPLSLTRSTLGGLHVQIRL